MASHDHYEQAPQVAFQNFPEVTQSSWSQQSNVQYQHPPQLYYQCKPEDNQSHLTNPLSQVADNSPSPVKPKRICGCIKPVFFLSFTVVVLIAVVLGLSAATGIEANRAADALDQLQKMINQNNIASTTSDAPSATRTSTTDLGCGETPTKVNNTTHTAFSLLGGTSFTIFCNTDAPNSPLLSLFTSSFANCIDACSAYSKYLSNNFNNTPATFCAGVSFIPLWTTHKQALAASAPGNCYLKPSPQNESGLRPPNIGTTCHAAIISE